MAEKEYTLGSVGPFSYDDALFPAALDTTGTIRAALAPSDDDDVLRKGDTTSGIAAPSDADYVTLSLNGNLSGERVLAVNATNLSLNDGGANGNVTINTIQDINTSAVPQFAGLGLGVVPSYKLSIGSTDSSNQIGIYHDNVNAYFKTDDGHFIFQTDEGTNAITWLDVKGKGTGSAYVRVFDESNYGQFYQAGTQTHLTSASGVLYFQALGDAAIYMFSASASGETQELKIYGYKAGDAKRSLEIGVGVDAANTASFDGVSNYYFDGNMGIGTPLPKKKVHIESSFACLRLSDSDAANDQEVNALIEFYRGNNTNRVGYLAMDSTSNNIMALATDYAAGILQFRTGSGIAAMTIDNAQNVGIGLTTVEANYKLIVRRATDVNFGIGLQGSELALTAFNDAISANVPMRFYASEYNFINGNLGINTTTPATKLEAVSADNVSATNIAVFFANNESLGVGIGRETIRQTVGNNNLYIDAAGSGNLILQSTATGNVGVSDPTPTVKFSVNGKAGMSVEGGHLIRLVNKTGINSIRGVVVKADAGVNQAFDTATANCLDPIGVVYESDIADGSLCWVVVAGIAWILTDATGNVVRGDRLITSATPGRADVNNAPSIAVHFQEIAHAIDGALAENLVLAVVHFL